MKKSAEAAIEKPISDAIAEAIQEAKADSDLNFLKKQKEDEIRMRLDQFAKELSQVKKQRDQH
jgi:FixJ family two-component response regulator